MEEREVFVDFLKELIQDEGINVAELAKRIGCNKSAVIRWVHGEFLPAPETLIKIAFKFNISTDYMFGLSEIKSLNKFLADSTLYDRYVKQRNLCNLKDFNVATACKLGDGSLSKWKNMKKLPEIETIIKVVKLLGCSLDYMLGIGK